ncbi:hypothetical protein LQG66_28010 [Bradyrhizobium ontarionense]|uniref:Uncharacterized protein n=1 Tax=Bradyrhizobium ontarionense TaxID=2898149 RepID=A0ABY3R7N7_9BRAD|nr:hypothetical protein [Bradyrhizobium sp. A19]UFZ03062.1 hypothetical protein LQG66_28010 [Bradyrhizobium sp. A19]
MALAARPRAPRQQGLAGGQEDEIPKAGAAEAPAGFDHDGMRNAGGKTGMERDCARRSCQNEIDP